MPRVADIAGFDLFCILKLGAEAIATQTDMYARPQMSDQKGQKTGQVVSTLIPAQGRRLVVPTVGDKLMYHAAAQPAEACWRGWSWRSGFIWSC